MFGVSEREGRVLVNEETTQQRVLLLPLVARLRAGLLAHQAERAGLEGQVDVGRILFHDRSCTVGVVEALALATELFVAACQVVASGVVSAQGEVPAPG